MFTQFHKTIGLAGFPLAVFLVLSGSARGQVDMGINESVWKQKYGVLDAQLEEQGLYTGWLGQDADGDGTKNRDEFAAGTNPFKKLPSDPHFRPPEVTANPASLSLGFPTVPGKLYQAQGANSLMQAWTSQFLPNVTGDGSPKILSVPKSAGSFFRIGVSDQATQGDQVSDWAKIALGFSPAAGLASQSSYTSNSLASALGAENVVSIGVLDSSAVQPPDSATAAGEFGVIRVARSGSILPGGITVPITIGGTAVEGVDYAPLPDFLTFPPGVNALDVKITPLFNGSRKTTATVIVTASAPETAGAAGNYTLGNPAFGGVTIYQSGVLEGTGLTARYYNGASSTYINPINFGGKAVTYRYTRINATTGSAVVTYAGSPEVPYVAGGQARLQVTSGNLNIAPFNTAANYTIAEPVTSTSFTINITGMNLPVTDNDNETANLGNFNAALTRLDATVDSQYFGTPNGTSFVNIDNHSVRWDGYLAPAANGGYTFQLDADDKARVLLDTGSGLVQILENGWNTAATGGFKQSAVIPLVKPANFAGRYHIVVEYAETTGAAKCKFQWNRDGGAYSNIPNNIIFVNGTETAVTGWTASYYNNADFTPPVARTQTDSAVTNGNNGDWGTGKPDPSISHDNFTARWTGQVLPQYSGKYWFVARIDDGVRLWVNNQLIVDRWPGGGSEDRTGTINLQAGVLYDIQMDYYEGTGIAESRLSWYSEDQAKQIIPVNRLFPTLTGAAPLGGDPAAAPPVITSPTQAVAVIGSGVPYATTLTSSNSGVITASGLPTWLTLVNGVLSGTPPSAGIYQFTLTATNIAGSSSAIMTLEVVDPEGQLTRELWTANVTGPAIADVPWNQTPNVTDLVPVAEDNTAHAANTGERLRGYLIAPTTANYYFWIAASNVAELWISNDSEPVNKVLRSRVNGPTGTASRVWSAQATQKSAWLSLVAGRKYYFEALHNTGASGSGNNLAIGWFADPVGTTANPIADGSGLIPSHLVSPWDNPPTTTIPGTLYVTNLQGAAGLGNITATGGAFLRVNGSNAVLQINHAGLSSGIVSRKIFNASDQVVFDIGAQEKNYPALKTSDGGFSWGISGADLQSLNNGELQIRIATLNHPSGEITGTFGKTEGSQVAPTTPAYPGWTDDHGSNDAANSRFLSQATFGPSPADMALVKSIGYRAWIDGQFETEATRNVPYVLANLSNDPQNPYRSELFFNSWWKNSVTGPDQLRQRAAFALSEIFVVSDTGPLNGNGRYLADYYDSLLGSAFGNFRDILKQVTLSPAMGVYLDMRANAAGNIQTGVQPNENYAREILQLFSAGLYRRWPDGSLVLNSKGLAVPTYEQKEITGFARVFTGWNWGQPLIGTAPNKRLPTNFGPGQNFIDPMVLVANRHELGSKFLLDNVVLPPATVTSQSDVSTDPASTYSVQSTIPNLPAGTPDDQRLETTLITNRYDLNGVKDLEQTFDNIMNNSAVAPYICRQLIQRLVTSHPKPAYVARVVRAFNGERNVDGVATGLRGDMREVFRAILLDSEARSTNAAADVEFGKQREPVLRVTGPARAFPSPLFPGSTYRQIGSQFMRVTTPVAHRLASESVMLSNFVDAGGVSSDLPPGQSYTATGAPGYTLVGSTGIATIAAGGYQAGDVVDIQFTGTTALGITAPYNTARTYTVVTATPANFTVNIGSTAFGNVTSNGTTSTPVDFTVSTGGVSAVTYTSVGTAVTLTSNATVAGHQLYLKFTSGGLAGAGYDGVYTVQNGTSGTSSNFKVTLPTIPAIDTATASSVLISRLEGGYNVTDIGGGTSTIALQVAGAHNLEAGDDVQLRFRITNDGVGAVDGIYEVDSIKGPNSFTVVTPTRISAGSQGSGGMYAYPLLALPLIRGGTVDVGPSTFIVNATQNDLGQTPLNSSTVFNFFYPDYQHPGTMARRGMTTPEFQLTNDSTIMNLTNAITGGILSGTANGYTSFKTNAIVCDLGSYMTPAQTNAAGIPVLVDTLATLLIGGSLDPAARTTIINYITNTANFPYGTPPTTVQMRDRVRAIVHLIVSSSRYAIQK